MKFMKLGTRPDTFYTEEATRTVSSDVPSDLVIRINNITYLLHRLLTDSGDSDNDSVELHDIPGGEDAFELCAKFCYGITINLSAHNFVRAFCAAKFLRMTESVEKGNFVLKLEAFFNSCILEGWKDSVVALQSTGKMIEWSENLGITRRCIDSIVEKILTPPAKVNWSFTYSRPGYCPQVNKYGATTADGEALHVYACRWLPDTTKIRPPESSASLANEPVEKNRRVLETIVNMIPADRGSVSVNFLLRLLSTASYLGASPVTKTELIRRCGLQLDEVTVDDLLLPSHLSSDQYCYDIDMISVVLESFLVLWRIQYPAPSQDSQFMRSIRKVGKVIDCYLQVAAKDANMPVMKFISLAEALPDTARPKHDDLYKAINIYLKEHPDLNKAEKKRLCRILDCQKLSPDVCAHAVKNERLPLRTVVQVLFFDQERGFKATSQKLPPRGLLSRAQEAPFSETVQSKPKLPPDDRANRQEGTRRAPSPAIPERDQHKKLHLKSERNIVISREPGEVESEK
ncbi:BTB/POZ domain-containing protein [Vitis vinifera]|uniref:BTB/POZ domain-containing protein n=1 Tax=Vitis vinifera TaxID=29760 RepID=A0A438D410_VITVI|nr:BTB/POZ domain-containing protein [Vitis vinifera]